MVFDACVKLGASFKGTCNTAEDYLKEMKENEIDQALIVAEKPLSYDISAGNDYIEEVLDKYPEKFYGAVRIDPWNQEQAKKELSRLSKEGFKAIYLNPWEENYQINSDIVIPIMEYALNNNISIVVESGYVWVSHVTQIADIAERYPKVKILMNNAGQMDLSGYSLTDVKYFMTQRPNLYIGTDAAVGAEWLTEMYRKETYGRVVFETNYPFYEVKLEKARINLGFFDENERVEVYSKNIKQFLNVL